MGGEGHNVIHIPLFQCQDGRHNFRGAGICPFYIGILLINDFTRLVINENGAWSGKGKAALSYLFPGCVYKFFPHPGTFLHLAVFPQIVVVYPLIGNGISLFIKVIPAFS